MPDLVDRHLDFFVGRVPFLGRADQFNSMPRNSGDSILISIIVKYTVPRTRCPKNSVRLATDWDTVAAAMKRIGLV